MKRTLKTTGTFQGTFNLNSLVQVIILVHLLKKRNRVNEVNLGQTKLSLVSESYTLRECTSNRIWRHFFDGGKKSYFQELNKTKFTERDKKMNNLDDKQQ